MRRLAGLGFIVLLAGCAMPQIDPCHAGSASSCGTTLPPQPKVAFDGSLAFQPQGGSAVLPFHVDNGTQVLVAEAWFNVTGPWFLAPEPGTMAVDVGIDDPSGGAHDVAFGAAGVGQPGASGTYRDIVRTQSPVPGAWSIDLDGEGSGVTVWVRITEGPAGQVG